MGIKALNLRPKIQLRHGLMHNSLFHRLGILIHRYRWPVLVMALLALLICTPFITDMMTPFQSTGFIDPHSESAKAQAFLDKKLKFYHENQFLILYHSEHLVMTNPLYSYKIKNSLMSLNDFPVEHDIIYPDMNTEQISQDKHTAYVVVTFHQTKPLPPHVLTEFRKSIKKIPGMSIFLGGEAIFADGVNQQTQKDLYKADLIAAPVTIIVLILVFGSLVAACVPLVLGGCCALVILTLLYMFGHVFTLSIFTLNIALLLGLCLNLDYALFIINRFRSELQQHEGNVQMAITVTLATAGRAVFFSGLAVFSSLSALLLFPINILFSIGVGGLVATFVAVIIAIIVLPALLSLLNKNINLLPVNFMQSDGEAIFIRWQKITKRASKYPVVFFLASMLGGLFLLVSVLWNVFKKGLRWIILPFYKPDNPPIWRTIALCVVKRPLFFFFSSLMILLVLGYPFLNVYFGISDFNILPQHSESRRFFDIYQEQFNKNELTPILLVVSKSKGNILSQEAVSKLYNLTTKLSKHPLVKRVDSIVTSTPRLLKNQYQALYQNPKHGGSSLKTLLDTTTREHFTVINVVSKYDVNSEKTKQLIHELRDMSPGQGLTMQLTGTPVINLDVSDKIAQIFPYAITWIMVLTYIILFVVLRSIFLPLKAIFMNMLSLAASYGVMVYVFQQGHFHHLLHFVPQGIIDISLVIIVFCAIFGFSMDYEVFLLTRIHESYLKTGNNKLSIIFGIEQSSRIITSAALIVICICGSFMVADVLMVKEFGLGIAVAIFVDAFIIRSLLVPSTMVLLKSWNWYLPNTLKKLFD
jgi:RND superfamily putative drug exporter